MASRKLDPPAVALLAAILAWAVSTGQAEHDDCKCKYQGRDLPMHYYNQSVYGNFSEYPAVGKYGTMCAAWDMVPGNPWHSSCTPDKDFGGEQNWCQIPWCYVDAGCDTAVSSDVFPGQELFYSYGACSAPDCYNEPKSPGCPYDPYGQGSHTVFDPQCPCIFHGYYLPHEVVHDYPSSAPGHYHDNPHIYLYGTTCAAWDQSPDTPWYEFCPMGADWCTQEYNWCQIPWCYVSPECPSAVESSVFEGSDVAYYSYNTCMGAPDCYNHPEQEMCPFTESENFTAGTGVDCPDGWREDNMGDCTCKFQGADLPMHFYNESEFHNYTAIAKYGTMCAAWDQVPGTPWHSSCTPGKDFGGEQNWCQIPWCYVDASCKTAMHSDVFEGQELFYSYGACSAPDCYNKPDSPGCPYDPYGLGSHTVFDPHCPCIFHGQHLPSEVVHDYPSSAPGVYHDNPHIYLYGTTCASWDQSPDTPWHAYCPMGADWCHPEYNWCQIPWCYVSPECPSAVESSVFEGSDVAYYSYNTCMGAPDCYNHPEQEGCPFQDKDDMSWGTGVECPEGWPRARCIKIPRAKAEKIRAEVPEHCPA